MLEGRCLPSTVTTLNDAGLGSLRDAIAITASGGTVDFQAGLSGTIILTSGELAITRDLTIAGPGADLITVSGNHTSRVFNIGAAFTVDISGMTIANGLVTNASGGGISNSGTLTVTNTILSGNFGTVWDIDNGAGIFNSGSLTVTSSTISGNSTAGLGGGIFNSGSGTVSVTNSTLSSNQADGAGGIWNSGTLTVTNSTLSANGAAVGGGITNSDGAMLTVTNSTLSANVGSSGAGGIGNGGTATVTNCTLTGNASGGGDGGCILNGGTLTVTDSTLSGNSAFGGDGGGGIANGIGTVTITNSTLSGNFAGGSGGGILNDRFGTVTITSSTLSGNIAGYGAGIFSNGSQFHSRNTIIAGNTAPSAPDVDGNLGSQGYNLIGNTQGGSGFDATDLLNLDPLLGPLQDNGGPTHTHALRAGSPALNAGDPNELGVPDQRGVVRSGGVNIGAYQASADHLVFLQQPADTAAGQTMAAVIVQVVDQFGNAVIGDNTHSVTLSIGNNPSGGTLSGTVTVTVVNGVATFSDLSIDQAGDGYTLHASVAGSLPDIDSNPFNITL
jgi:hypothetical protein